jgi:hypothetical protein
MQIIETRGNLEILAGAGMAAGLYCARDKKSGKISLWDNDPHNFKQKDCKY